MTVRSKFMALGSLAVLAGCAFIEELTQTAPPPAPPAAAESAPVDPDVPTPGRKPTPPLQAALPSPTTPSAAPAIEATQLEQLTPEQTTDLLGSDRSRQRCLEQLALEHRPRGSGSSARPR
jgi:hypothetical protein